jgi:hypothetical protein
MKAVLSLTVFCMFALAVSGQETAKAIKVGEFQEERNILRDNVLHEKITAFIERLSAEPPTSRGALLFTFRYKMVNECLSSHGFAADKRVLELSKRILGLYPNLAPERIIFVENEDVLSYWSSVEFWVVPQGAPTPKAPYLDFDPPCACSPLDVYGIPRVRKEVKSVKFTAWIGRPDPPACAKFSWVVTGGVIIGGQGTDQITVDLSDNLSNTVTATVEIEGADPSCNCPNTASYTTRIL